MRLCKQNHGAEHEQRAPQLEAIEAYGCCREAECHDEEAEARDDRCHRFRHKAGPDPCAIAERQIADAKISRCSYEQQE